MDEFRRNVGLFGLSVPPSGTLVVVVPFVATFFRGITLYIGIANIGLTPVDFVVPLLGLYTINQVARGHQVKLSRPGRLFLAAFGLLILWHVIRIPAGGSVLRSTTLTLQLARNWLLVAIVLTFAKTTDIRTINRIVFSATAIVSTLSVTLWALASALAPGYPTFFETFHFTPSSQLPGFESSLIRSEWLVGDPNLYGIILVVGLFCGVTILQNHRQLVTGLQVSVIVVALVLTFSRSAVLVALGAGALAVGSAFRNRGVAAIREYVGPLLVGLATSIVALTLDWPLANHIKHRLAFGVLRDRRRLWTQLLATLDGHLLFGRGLRSVEATVGRYAHNSYLSILYQTGLVGLALYGMSILVVLAYTVRDALSGCLADRQAWFFAFLAMGAFHLAFTYVYLPLSWLVAAVVLAGIGETR